MKRIIIISFLLVIVLLTSCQKEKIISEPNDTGTEETLYWLSFKVTCWKNNEYKPVFVNVEIFRNEVSMENGSTSIQDGWYASLRPYYRASDNARIKLTDVSSGDVLMEVFNISPISDPIWFVDAAEKRRTNSPSSDGAGHMHLGSCN